MRLSTRSFLIRRTLPVTAGGAALLVALAATAWACTSSGGPLVHDLYQDRGPVGTTVSVGGEGWAAATPVRISWRPAMGANHDLVTVETDAKGRFEVPVVVPAAAAGVHQVVVAQGPTARMTPFEVIVEAEQGFPARGLDAFTTRPAGENGPAANGGRSRALLATMAAAVLAAMVAAAMALSNRSRRCLQTRP